MRHREWHRTERISWLRAAVLGALPPVSSLPTAGALRQNILLSGGEAWLPVRSRWRIEPSILTTIKPERCGLMTMPSLPWVLSAMDFTSRRLRSPMTSARPRAISRSTSCLSSTRRTAVMTHRSRVQYIGANVPQAWAAGSAFMLTQAMLGFNPDAPNDKVYIDPWLPAWLPDLTVVDLRVGRHKLAIRFWREGSDG